MSYTIDQAHGKSRVRVARTWREGDVHHFVEWMVATMLESPMEHAYRTSSNEGMTATDTQKNTVYTVAQRMTSKCSMEQYAIALAQHFVRTYPLVSKAKISVEQKPWARVQVDGKPHNHGYAVTGTEVRTVYVEVDKAGNLEVTSGVKDMQVLKTTQSGYAGFLKDQYTALPDTNERIVATSVTANWKYSTQPPDYCAAFATARQALCSAFFGPPKGGVFSPSVQFTLHSMATALLQQLPEVDSVFLNLPNLHFLPTNPVGGKPFAHDVYTATSEPHGNIEARISRPKARL